MSVLTTSGRSINDSIVIVTEIVSGRKSKVTSYTDDTRTEKIEEEVYTYSGSSLIKKERTAYHSNGEVSRIFTEHYFEESGNPSKSIVKRS